MNSGNAEPAALHQYNKIQRTFHWLMAVIILAAIPIGVYAAMLVPGTSPRRELLEIHKSLGMAALVLVLIRFAYRLFAGEPAFRVALTPLVQKSSKAAHFALYILMVATPLSGYVFSAAGGYPLSWFGIFSWPRLLPLDKPLAHLGQEFHFWFAWAIGAVLALHVLAALWHHFAKRDEVLSRMLPAARSQR